MSGRVVIGVYLHSEPGRLQATLESLARHSAGTPVLLLPDAPDAATTALLKQLTGLPQLPSRTEQGMAAAFNRMVAAGEAEILLLLESGSVITAGAVERIIEALSLPGVGLAGPSTNLCWNEQCIPGAPAQEASRDAVDRFAGRLAARYEAQIATLSPLYSLSDFCYAVRREVTNAIGSAEEAYGPGPCWEMDYNIRAARAGFDGVWVKDAYVHRGPLPARRISAERQWLEPNKRRYQDKFCGLRLNGGKTDYRAHCRGDACPNFAPRPSLTPVPLEAEPVRIRVESKALVSCIMPTCDRRRFAAQALQYFARQDYPERELIVVDDGTDPVADIFPKDGAVRYLRMDRRLSLGEKRNHACEHAAGEIVIHWDDDDWMSPRRISRQVAALQQAHADVCGFATLLFHEPASGRSWRYAYGGRKRDWLAGGTLCYRKAFWKSNRFPALTIGEDARFLWSARSKKLLTMDDKSLYVAIVHPGNTSPKRTGDTQWQPFPTKSIYRLLGNDAVFYQSAPPSPALVSCLMPTRNRREYLPNAIAYFLRQDYAPRELVVVDDGTDRVADLIPDDPSVRYIRLPARHALGEKRNLGVEAARGEYIVHWDDDDWYAPGRLTAQLQPLRNGRADITALAMRTVLSLPDFRFWRCRPELHARLHHRDICCGTIAYPRALWRKYGPYPRVDCGEDVGFLSGLDRKLRIERIAEEHLFICVRHGRNTWRIGLDWKREPRGWERMDVPDFLPAGDLALYSKFRGRPARAPLVV